MFLRTVLAASGIVTSLFTAALAQVPQVVPLQNLPQTQMAAAAVVMGQVVFMAWRVPTLSDLSEHIQIIDNKTAHIRGIFPGTGTVLGDANVVKLDDCRFEAVRGSSTKLATINLGVLSDEYQQASGGQLGYQLRVTVIGNGQGEAVCSSFVHRCFNDLTLGLGGLYGAVDPESAWRALRAVQFLQKYCPPQRRGF